MRTARSATFVVTALAILFRASAASAGDTGTPVDHARYKSRRLSPDFTEAPCPDNPRGLIRIGENLYRHTTGAGLAVHSGLVLVTAEGYRNVRFSDEVKGWTGYETTRVLNILGMYRWVSNHRRGDW